MQAPTMTPPRNKADSFESPDFYCIDDLLTAEHKLVRSAVRDFVKREISPIVEECAQRAEFPKQLVQKFGKIGAFGATIPTEYGGGGLDQISYGLMTQEIERGDSGMRSCVSVQNSLVMHPIHAFGSDEQKRKFLPRLATGELIGCFGLTEPNHGSDPGSMETNFIERSDYYLLNGSKIWITNAAIADIGIVWARSDQGKIRGLILERGMERIYHRRDKKQMVAAGQYHRRNGFSGCTGAKSEYVTQCFRAEKCPEVPGTGALRH